MRIFAGKRANIDVASQPQLAEFSACRFFAIIAHRSSNRVGSLPNKGFGHAISKSHCDSGVRGGNRRLNVRRQLGRTCAARLLRAGRIIVSAGRIIVDLR
jgi:hypothetical protein